MAQAHGLDAGEPEHRAGQHRHGVGVVEEPGVRADFLHVPGEVQHHRDGAQRPEHAADAQRVRDGLLEAVLLRDLEVGDGAGLVAAHLDGVDHVVRALERSLAVFHAQVSLDAGPGAVVSVDGLEHRGGFGQPRGVHVVERDDALLERRGHHAVAQHVLGKYGRARAHKGDLRDLIEDYYDYLDVKVIERDI